VIPVLTLVASPYQNLQYLGDSISDPSKKSATSKHPQTQACQKWNTLAILVILVILVILFLP